MKRSYLWYALIAILALTPVALRAFTWPSARQHELKPATVQAGEVLFKHEWKPNDPLAATGDGLGPVYNAKSCKECHFQGGVGGAGGLNANVTTFTVQPLDMHGRPSGKVREGVVHAKAHSGEYVETLAHVHKDLPPVSQPPLRSLLDTRNVGQHCPPADARTLFPPGVHISQRNTPALFGAKLIDEIPDNAIIAMAKSQWVYWGMPPTATEELPVGRAHRLPDGRIGHFGWKAQAASLSDFVQAACANELGLGNPGQAQPRSLAKPDYVAKGHDLTLNQCNQMTAYIASLPRPQMRLPADSYTHEQAEKGKVLFSKVGCADCHTPEIGGVDGIYSDLLLHDMGADLEGSGSYNEPRPGTPPNPDPTDPNGPRPGEWRTPPLWGVADSGPYMHDGRAGTLEEAIGRHGGQARRSMVRFEKLTPAERAHVVAFLKTLRAPEAH